MTVDSYEEPGGVVAPWVDDDSIGLEDLDASDVSLPRLSIVHADGVFKSNLSGETFSYLDTILLGMVRQRIMWHPVVDEGDRPMCRSTDFIHGFPNSSDRQPADKRFPWAESVFTPDMALPVIEPPSEKNPEGFDSNGHPVLNCASCNFKEWGRSPSGKGTPPACSEQFTFPLLYTPDSGVSWLAAILTLQRTGVKPAKAYMSSFVQSKTPLFSVMTRLQLTQQSRGSVRYSVPSFQRLGASERSQWGEYATQMRAIRSWVRQAPRNDDPAPVEASSSAWDAEAAAASAPTPPPAAPPAPPAAPTAPPAPPRAATPPPPPAAPKAATPPPPPTARPSMAPPRPAAATPAPPSMPATAVPPGSVEDDDDIPF